MKPSVVLDASALLAVLKGETGHERVIEAMIQGAALGTVNLGEVVGVFARVGTPAAEVTADILRLGLSIEPFTAEDAQRAGGLIRDTSEAGLSFGDRACLALALRLGCPVLTADRAWSGLDVGVEVILVR